MLKKGSTFQTKLQLSWLHNNVQLGDVILRKNLVTHLIHHTKNSFCGSAGSWCYIHLTIIQKHLTITRSQLIFQDTGENFPLEAIALLNISSPG